MHTIYATIKKIDFIPKGTVLIAKRVNHFLEIIYIGRCLTHTMIDVHNLKKMKHLGFKIENLDDYSTGELYKFLSSKNETELARTAISILKNKLKKETEKANDFKKLYEYWKDLRLDNISYQKPDRYSNVSYDYKKIKQDNCKINTEIIKKFKLFGASAY